MKTKIFFSAFLILAGLSFFSSANASLDAAVDLKANGLDGTVSIMYGSKPVLSWTSINMTSCIGYQFGSATSTTGWEGSVGPAGEMTFDNVTKNTFFSITCQDNFGTTVRDSVNVTVNPLTPLTIKKITSNEPRGAIVIAKTASITGDGFLPTGNTITIATSTYEFELPYTVTATSSDTHTLFFTVPDLSAKSYNFWVSNWNGTSNMIASVIATSSPVIIIPPVTVTPPPITPPITTPTPVTLPITTTPGVSPCVAPSVDLRLGSRDALTKGGVSILQKFLQQKGYLSSAPTGYFGALTVTAVKKLQSINKISATGYVGALTRAKIKMFTCSK